MRVLLITLDATFHDDAQALRALPTLGALARRGVFCDNVQTVYPTLTYPVHASILTGCYPDRHGIAHNQPFQPDAREDMRAWNWDARDIKVKTLHQAAAEKGMRVASMLWPVSGFSKSVRWNFPEVLPLPGENAALKMMRYGSAAWILRDELRYGKRRKSLRQPDLDEYAAFLCQKLVQKRAPDMLTLHLTDCDSMRHAHGVFSPEAREAFTRLDNNVATVLNAYEARGLLEDTLIVVASDHGQADVQKSVPLDALLRGAGIPARAQTLGMGAYIFCEPSRTDAVARALAEHMEKYSISRVYDDAALRALRAPEGVALAVEAAPGVEFIDGAHTSRATHGFGAQHPAAKCLLWLCGRSVRAGETLAEAALVDIAPTVCYLLGLTLPEADGRVLREALIA